MFNINFTKMILQETITHNFTLDDVMYHVVLAFAVVAFFIAVAHITNANIATPKTKAATAVEQTDVYIMNASKDSSWTHGW